MGFFRNHNLRDQSILGVYEITLKFCGGLLNVFYWIALITDSNISFSFIISTPALDSFLWTPDFRFLFTCGLPKLTIVRFKTLPSLRWRKKERLKKVKISVISSVVATTELYPLIPSSLVSRCLTCVYSPSCVHPPSYQTFFFFGSPVSLCTSS